MHLADAFDPQEIGQRVHKKLAHAVRAADWMVEEFHFAAIQRLRGTFPPEDRGVEKQFHDVFISNIMDDLESSVINSDV